MGEGVNDDDRTRVETEYDIHIRVNLNRLAEGVIISAWVIAAAWLVVETTPAAWAALARWIGGGP